MFHNDIAKNPIIRYILFENAISCEPIAILRERSDLW